MKRCFQTQNHMNLKTRTECSVSISWWHRAWWRAVSLHLPLRLHLTFGRAHSPRLRERPRLRSTGEGKTALSVVAQCRHPNSFVCPDHQTKTLGVSHCKGVSHWHCSIFSLLSPGRNSGAEFEPNAQAHRLLWVHLGEHLRAYVAAALPCRPFSPAPSASRRRGCPCCCCCCCSRWASWAACPPLRMTPRTRCEGPVPPVRLHRFEHLRPGCTKAWLHQGASCWLYRTGYWGCCLCCACS